MIGTKISSDPKKINYPERIMLKKKKPEYATKIGIEAMVGRTNLYLQGKS